jgi:hypothetical protein
MSVTLVHSLVNSEPATQKNKKGSRFFTECPNKTKSLPNLTVKSPTLLKSHFKSNSFLPLMSKTKLLIHYQKVFSLSIEFKQIKFFSITSVSSKIFQVKHWLNWLKMSSVKFLIQMKSTERRVLLSTLA